MTSTELTTCLRDNLLIFDGAMGTELYRRHVFTNRCFDEICLSDPGLVAAVHADYLQAGAEVITTNTFGANTLSLQKYGLSERMRAINLAAVEIARRAAAAVSRPVLVAGSLGPLALEGTVLQSQAEQLRSLLAQARVLLEAGADFLLFETLPNPAADQLALAVMAALPAGTPFMLSHAVPDAPHLPEVLAHRLRLVAEAPVQPFAVGLNCGMGPDRMLEAVEAARHLTSLPLVVQPNSGTPHSVENRQLYLCSPEYFATYAVRYVNLGVKGIGGCCGTTPAHIREMALAVKPLAKAVAAAVPATVAVPAAPLPRQPETPLRERSRLARKLADREWIAAVEISPPKGWNTERILASARICLEAGVDAINIPDGPRAAPRLSAMVTAMLIQQRVGIETVLHVCCRDRNFISLQADLLGCAACGLHNVLFITGDPPKLGGYAFASGVFDTDAIGLVGLQKHLNQGVDLGGQVITPPTAALIGVGADPNALDLPRELERVRRKAEAGAEYITTQPVFDPQALERFVAAIADLRIPVVAGIWPLASLRNALFMKNEVPGVVVPDAVVERMARHEGKEEQLQAGIAIAREAIARVRPLVAGVQVSAPLGNVQAALQVLEA